MSRTALIAAFCIFLSGAALAQQGAMDQSKKTAMDPGLMDAMSRMDKSIPKDSAGSVDADFVRMMIPHHQSAVDMAKVELAKGKDPQLRKLATRIIASQRKEITQMKMWLKKHKIN